MDEQQGPTIRSTWNSAQCYVAAWMGGEFEGECIHVYLWLSLFAAPWTAAFQATLSMGFSRQEHWSGLPFSSPGDLPDLGIEPLSPRLAGGFFTTEPPKKPVYRYACVCVCVFVCSPGGSDGKESACSAGDLGSITGSGRSPGGGQGNPLQYSCLRNPRGP